MTRSDTGLASVDRFIEAMSVARDELRKVRQALWNGSFISTKELMWLDRVHQDGRGYRADVTGQMTLAEVALVAKSKNNRDVTAYVEVFVSPDGWRLNSYIGVLAETEGEDIAWQGLQSSGSQLEHLEDVIRTAAHQTAEQLLAFDFDNSRPRDIAER